MTLLSSILQCACKHAHVCVCARGIHKIHANNCKSVYTIIYIHTFVVVINVHNYVHCTYIIHNYVYIIGLHECIFIHKNIL